MKKFAVLMVFVMLLSVILTGCAVSSTQDSGKVCDVLISPDELESYIGQKATLVGSHAGVTVLDIGGKQVCVTQNGLFSTNIDEGLFVQVRTKYQQNQYYIDTVPLGYDFSNMYSGMTGTIGNVVSSRDFGTGPMIILDKTLELVYEDSCEVLDYDSIEQLNGKTVKATGVWVPVGEEENEEYDPMIVYVYQGQNYCFDGYLDIYKTIEVFGKQHHVSFEAGYWNYYSEPLIFGDTGVISVEPRGEGYLPNVFFDVGEGNREDEVDPMIEEIGSRGGYIPMWYLGTQSWYGEILNDGQSTYSLIFWEEAPQLNPGYLFSPKSYTYGGMIDVGTVIGKIDGKPVTISSIENRCEQLDPNYSSIDFEVSFDGEYVGFGWGQTVEYFAMIKGNGADQEIVYYKFDASAFCPK